MPVGRDHLASSNPERDTSMRDFFRRGCRIAIDAVGRHLMRLTVEGEETGTFCVLTMCSAQEYDHDRVDLHRRR
jgi:hypothetical protein